MQISRMQCYSTSNNLKVVRDTAIFTMAGQSLESCIWSVKWHLEPSLTHISRSRHTICYISKTVWDTDMVTIVVVVSGMQLLRLRSANEILK